MSVRYLASPCTIELIIENCSGFVCMITYSSEVNRLTAAYEFLLFSQCPHLASRPPLWPDMTYVDTIFYAMERGLIVDFCGQPHSYY